MPTICPNCLRPVRADAKFCGYCGSGLALNSHDDGPEQMTATIDKASFTKEPVYKPQPKPKGAKARRTVLMVIIILLCLVLLLAFSVYYFQLIR
jgi:zinc-ribbon domain